MAQLAVARTFDQIGAAIPLRRLVGMWLKAARMKIECVPARHRLAPTQWPRHFRRFVLLRHGRNGVEVRFDGADIRTRHLGEPRIGKYRIEVRAVAAYALVQRVIEILLGP